jgi:hypothetical protein
MHPDDPWPCGQQLVEVLGYVCRTPENQRHVDRVFDRGQ